MHFSQPTVTASSVATATALLAACCSDDDDGEASKVVQPPVASTPQVPNLDSWRTDLSGRYARVLETTSFPATTWPAAGITDASGASGSQPIADFGPVTSTVPTAVEVVSLDVTTVIVLRYADMPLVVN